MFEEPKRPQKRKRTSPVAASSPEPRDVLRDQIELRAYHKFCERGCVPGHELEDWLAAEEELVGALSILA